MAAPITTRLVLNTKNFTKGIGVATKGLGRLGGAVGGALGLITKLGLAFTAFGGVITALILRQAKLIDRLGKVSDVIGVNVDTLQKFRFAAEQAGVSTDQADVALRRFSRRLGEAKRGTGELLPALRRLGIDVTSSEGRTKSAEAVLLEFADALEGVEDKSQRLALAFKAFDSEGAELVKTLANGSEGLQELFTQAEQFGLILDRDAIAATERFNDALNLLFRTLDTQVKRVIAELAPLLEEFAVDLATNVKESAEAAGGFENLAKMIKNTVIEVFIQFIQIMEQLGNVFLVFARLFRDAARSISGDPFLGMSKDAQQAAKDIEALEQQLEQVDRLLVREDLFNLPMLGGAFEAIIKGVDRLTSGETGQMFQGSIEEAKELRKQIVAAIRAKQEVISGGEIFGGEGGLDFSALIEQLRAFITPLEEINEKIIPEIIVKAEDMGMTFAKFLDMIFAEQRVTDFYDVVDSETATFMDKIKAALDLIFGGIKDGVLDFLDRVSEKLKAAGVGDAMKTLEDGFVKAAVMFEDALADAVVSGKADFDDLANHLKQVLAKALVQKFVTGPIMGLFGLAKGGPVMPNQPYIVGEKGPELMVPSTAGNIVPNNMLGGQQVTYNINAVDARSFKQLVAQDPEFIFSVTQAGARRMPS